MSTGYYFRARCTFQTALLLLSSILLSPRGAWAQGGLSADQVATIKAATVLVLVDTADEAASGSGFLIGKDDKYGYIATNQHVVETDLPQREIRIVLNSGLPGREVVLHAESMAEDSFRDLAVLRISANDLPQPLKLSSPQPVRETMPVWVFGFPFGEMLATSKLHPAITITTGTVTSMRLDDFGKVTRVQVDADINEGNSGGPIVDSSGGLVGIATEKVEDTKIGLGLPSSELAEMLQGRVKESGMHPVSNQNGKATYHAAVVLIDPLQNAKSVSMFMVPQAGVAQGKPDADGNFGMLSPDMKAIPLSKNGNAFESEVTLDNPQMTDVAYWQQIRLETKDGQIKWTYPIQFVVPFSRGVAPAAPGIGGGQTGNVGGAGNTAGGGNWLGGPKSPQPGAPGGTVAGNPLKPIETGQPLLGPVANEAGANYYRINVGDKILPNMLWSVDGKFVYLLGETGTVHEVSVPDFREVRVIRTGQKAKYMALTKLGLVVGFPELQEVWLLNANSLEPLKRIPVSGMAGLTGSSVSSRAYVPDGEDALYVIDLATGQVISHRRGSEFHLPEGMPGVRWQGESPGFHFATVTPDGKYLITGGENLNRMRIDGDDFVYEQAGPGGIGQNSQRLEVSADSQYVAMPAGGGNGRIPGQGGPYNTFVYLLSDLSTPVLAVSSGAYPRALALDKAAGSVYAQNFNTALMVFSAAGILQKSYKLGVTRGEETAQILPHPVGRHALVLSGKNLTWVDLSTP